MHYNIDSSSHFYDFHSKHMRLMTREPLATIHQMASKNPVVIFSTSTCCMCLAVKRLFHGLAVYPTVYELDQTPAGDEMEKALEGLQLGHGVTPRMPVVFVGGRLVGSMDRVLVAHISGSLVPLLKEAGALWL